MMTIEGVTKRFGAKRALDRVSFEAKDGRVTGFLGPNGAGKSTTMRVMLGLIRPDAGRTLIDGRPYASLPSPMRAVGAVLDAKSAHPGRSAEAHLKALALANGIPARRVDEVIELTGLGSARTRRAGTFSLGMAQRLSIAAALLGDPHNLVLDEPINGLDPEGIAWVRALCRRFAAEGRAVLLSSHLMSEVALTADDLVIIAKGRILETSSLDRFVAAHSAHTMRVATPQPDKLRAIFAPAAEVSVERTALAYGEPQDGVAFRIRGADLRAAADVFARAGLPLYALAEERASLEQVYLQLTHDQAEYLGTTEGSPR